MLLEAINKLEESGLRIEYEIDSLRVVSSMGRVHGEIFANSPIDSWLDSYAIKSLSRDNEHGVDLFMGICKEKTLKMPSLFILDTDNGMVVAGKSLSFTKSKPSILSGKQLDAIRVKIMGMNPKIYKVN